MIYGYNKKLFGVRDRGLSGLKEGIETRNSFMLLPYKEDRGTALKELKVMGGNGLRARRRSLMKS